MPGPQLLAHRKRKTWAWGEGKVSTKACTCLAVTGQGLGLPRVKLWSSTDWPCKCEHDTWPSEPEIKFNMYNLCNFPYVTHQ